MDAFKKYIIKALTDIKYKINIIIANQNDERDICTTCKKNQANDKNEEGQNPFISVSYKKLRGVKNIREFFNGRTKSRKVGKVFVYFYLCF